MGNATTEKARPNRMSRQRERTRDRLVKAALTVIARKGFDSATINDFTEEADVGFGSFYNYFSSKEEILAASIEDLYVRIGTKIDGATSVISEPLEVLASAIRLFVGLIIVRPDWAEFIVRVGLAPGYKERGLFPRLFRDIRKIEECGHLRFVDSAMATYSVGGAILFMVMALLDGELKKDDAPERIADMALRMLGVSEEQIHTLVTRPLPDFPSHLCELST